MELVYAPVDKNTKFMRALFTKLLYKMANCTFVTRFNTTIPRMLSLQKFTFNPFSENTYVLWAENGEAFIIDPGMLERHEEQSIVRFIEENELRLTALVCTHTHLDHVFGNAFILDKYKVPFIAHPRAMQALPMSEQAAKLYGIPLTPSPMPDSFIDHGDTLTLGANELEVRFTPGHAADHVVLIDHSSKRVIAGDVLFQGSIGRTDLPGGNHEELLTSIRQSLYTLPDEYEVYCGHGPETSIGAEKRSNPFVRG